MRTLAMIVLFTASTASAAEYTCNLAIFNDKGFPISHETKSGDLEKANLVLSLPEGFAVTVEPVVVGADEYIGVNFQKGESKSTALFDIRQAHLFQSFRAEGVQAQVQCWLENT